MWDLANKNMGCPVPLELQVDMKKFSVSRSWATFGGSPPPTAVGQSFLHPCVGAREPAASKAPQGQPPHSGPLPALSLRSPSQAAAGGRAWRPAVCRRGRVLPRQPRGGHQLRGAGAGRDPGPEEPHVCGPPVRLLPEAPARGRDDQDTRSRGEQGLADSMEDPERELHLPGAVLRKSTPLRGRPSSGPRLFW